jgi:import receptor subunit TOM70
MSRSLSSIQGKYFAVLFAGLTSALFLLYKFAFRPGSPDPRSTKLLKDLANPKDPNDDDADDDSDLKKENSKKGTNDNDTSNTPLHSNKKSSASSTSSSYTDADDGEESEDLITQLHSEIEQIDRRGKALFKKKNFLEAAEVFTEALDLIHSKVKDLGKHGNLNRQVVTLMNNRSAMYEKGGMPDLALLDCDAILEIDTTHTKARTRKLRILESLNRHMEALVEVCALQLKFMQDNRDKLRLGIPVTPPVPQSKIEQLMALIVPDAVEAMLQKIKAKFGENGSQSRPLPSCHTILQLLQSFNGYNAWMAKAAKDGSLDSLTSQLEKADTQQEKVALLLKRGRRYAYHRMFDKCKNDFETAYDILENDDDNTVKESFEDDTYPRVLEWVGMCRHLRYDLDGALKCYETCANMEPINAEILVKCAGVKMDAGKLEEAMKLFKTALELDPTAVDALLHRANLYMLQSKPNEAKQDLELCLELRPSHLLARLRLATVHMATEDLDGAKRNLDLAAEIDPDSSEVHSYRGELHFAQGEFIEAKAEFDGAIKCDAGNPTPYVNAALTVMNTPPAGGGPPDIPESIRLLEKAIEVDPQFHTAYVHLGQFKLSMATDLTTAKEVVALYDKGLDYCRTAEELKDIVSMRILTVAQVDAAAMLKMDTLNMQ